MIENITLGQMDAIVEVVCHLVNGLIPYLIIDRRYFRRTRLILRQLAVSRPPFNVKRRVLLHNRWLVHLLFKQQNSFHKIKSALQKHESMLLTLKMKLTVILWLTLQTIRVSNE